jgi:dTDP-glucose 4,6-dehydratase
VLFLSSGAVYGVQPPDLERVPEGFCGIQTPSGEYGLGKRLSEELCAQHREVLVTIARGFAFLAPRLPLDAHFAAGNFLADALRGAPILVKGDGLPFRSYLYGTDLATWLWTILLRGTPGRAYNVGSEQAVSIAQLAEQIASIAGTSVIVAQPSQAEPSAPRYVPSTLRARTELGLAQTVELPEAIRRTLRWHRNQEG